MGWIEIGLLVLGAFIMAANQALKDADMLTQRLAWMKPKPWWNYVPLACVCAAALLFGFRQIVSARYMDARPPSAIDPPAKESGDTVTLNGIDLPRLRSFFEGRTEYEANLLLQPFVGVDVRVSGRIYDMMEITKDRVIVFLGKADNNENVVSEFEGKQLAAISQKGKADQIDAKCKLASFRAHTINLGQCKLVTPKTP